MLRGLDAMLGSSIIATDGEIGKIYNVFFEDRLWTVRYLVVETGSWLTLRKVLISASVLGSPNWAEKTIPVRLTREQVQNCPDVDVDRPVSRQQELAMIRHYGWADYLNSELFAPPQDRTEMAAPELAAESEMEGDPYLRSAKEVAGYQVDASDGPLGNVRDFIIDDEGWVILDLVVNVESSSVRHKILVSTRWVASVSWEYRRVQLNRRREDAAPADSLTEA